MDAVRAALAAEVSAETERATNAKIHTAITEQLADLVTVDLPESLVQDQGRQNYSVQMLELLSAGQITQDVLQVSVCVHVVRPSAPHRMPPPSPAQRWHRSEMLKSVAAGMKWNRLVCCRR
jgi:ribosomal protein S12 methylthiotransferase accessory factor YcaO